MHLDQVFALTMATSSSMSPSLSSLDGKSLSTSDALDLLIGRGEHCFLVDSETTPLARDDEAALVHSWVQMQYVIP